MRTLRKGAVREPELVIQPPRLQSWPPLDVEKRHPCEHCATLARKRRLQNRIIFSALLVFLLYLFANVVFLNVRVLRAQRALPPTAVRASPTLSGAAQQCLLDFPGGSIKCPACLPELQAVPSDLALEPEDSQRLRNAIQFCGLQAVFSTATTSGQGALSNLGWFKDVHFCTWSGIVCDSSGLVSSLQLSFPAVPVTIPSEVEVFTGLRKLQIIGDTNIPGGGLPSSFAKLTSLSELHLESTALKTLPTNILDGMKGLIALVLVKNGQMDGNLPASVFAAPLQNIVVNNQPLVNPLQNLTSPSIKLIDLSSTGISGPIPENIMGLVSLVELHLDNNALALPLPGRFPSSLQTLTLANNAGLTGTVADSFCTLPLLQTCDMRGTGLAPPQTACGPPGVCQFPPPKPGV